MGEAGIDTFPPLISAVPKLTELPVSSEIGVRTDEAINWVNSHTGLFLSRLADLSLQKLNGLGWQEITSDETVGLCKFDFGNDQPLEKTMLKKGIKDGKIQFTGRQTCGYATAAFRVAMTEKFPDAQLTWVTLDADMSERTETSATQPAKHHLLEVTFPNEPPTLFDLTYGQVDHKRRLLVTPSSHVNTQYRDPYREEDDITRVKFQDARAKFDAELTQEGMLDQNDLRHLSDTFFKDVIQLQEV
jgi:hypothetical protein